MKLIKRNRSVHGRVIQALLLLGWLVSCWPFASVMAQESTRPKTILVLYWYGREFAPNIRLDNNIRTVLNSEPPGTVEYYPEYLESNRFPGERQSLLFRDYLMSRYADRKIDVIVAVSPVALNFVLKFCENLFAKTPIVYQTLDPPLFDKQTHPAGMTGVVTDQMFARTLDLALKWHPSTRKVLVVVGTSEHDVEFAKDVRDELKPLESRVPISYLSDLPLDELITRVREAPSDSIILYVRYSLDEPGKSIDPFEALSLISQSARVPIYSIGSPTLVGRGTVGGYFANTEIGEKTLVRMALQVAHGKDAESLPVFVTPNVVRFDSNQLKRWGIAESRLPPDSIVLFKQATFWQQYKWRISGVLALILVEAFLIITLLIQRSRRARAEESRRLSEEKFSKAFRSSPDAFVITRRSDGIILEVNDRWQDLLGYKRADAVGRTTLDLNVYAIPGDREEFLNQIKDLEFVHDFETDVRTGSGEIKRVVLSAETVNINKETCSLVIIRDVTEQRNSERALQKMTGQLISLRDEEQRRIAAELHDGLGQSLVIINNRALIGLRDASDSTRATEQFEEISSAASSAIDEVREIAYNLRPHELGKLGLVQAIRSMVSKVSQSSTIRFTTDLDELNGSLSVETETSIYRVVQEALNNVIKHAEASEANISLKRHDDELVIKIADNGKGIAKPSSGERSGFGLLGIGERARMLGGTSSVESAPNQGTIVTLALSLSNGNHPGVQAV